MIRQASQSWQTDEARTSSSWSSCRLVQKPLQLGTSAIISLFGVVDKAAGSPQLATSNSASTQASEQQQSPDSEEFDEPIVEEEEGNNQVPVPAAKSVSTAPATQE